MCEFYVSLTYVRFIPHKSRREFALGIPANWHILRMKYGVNETLIKLHTSCAKRFSCAPSYVRHIRMFSSGHLGYASYIILDAGRFHIQCLRTPGDKSRKTINFATSKVTKKLLFNHRPFISGYICSGTPSFDLSTPNFVGSSNLNSVPGSGPGTES